MENFFDTMDKSDILFWGIFVLVFLLIFCGLKGIEWIKKEEENENEKEKEIF